ncbi:PAS domain S-box protein [uncultured Desulfobacter sp.]|uniref:PAS domain S-box protein n=1 Tax=uncultured Desulfobacter sp. TaxID=240139 RepID=UPI002AABDDD9|nr:PAS domain S-box protein [uncultured Desulfobacter sp.]
MSENRNMQKYLYNLKLFALTPITLWIAIIIGFLVWEIYCEKRYAIEFARTEAIESYNKDLVHIKWAVLHGGVYVPETKETPPSPYLVDVKERDISTPSGRRLTLVNPAYMTRQVHKLSQNQYGVKGHITSLNLIRPQNKPDSWEEKALRAFDTGKKEVSSVDSMDGKDYFRLMRPMFVEEGCLKCHGYQEYQVGDIRGGISVSVPLAPYYAIASNKISKIIFVHFTILILGLMGLGGAFWAINKSIRERIVAESRFQRAMDASKDGIFDWDLETKKIYYSPGWKRMLGYEPDELPDDFSIWETLTHPDDVKASWVMMNEVIDGKRDRFEKEFKMRHKDGHWVDILSRGNLYKDEQSGRVRVVGTHVDISERKQIEKVLQENESRYHELFNNIKSGVAIYTVVDNGKDFIFKEFNKAGENLDGDRREALIGKSIFEVRPGIEEFGIIDVFRRVWQTDIPESFPATIYKDGRLEKWYENYVYALPTGDIVAVFDDVTEKIRAEETLKASEEWHRSILETAMDGIWQLDTLGKIIEVNQTYCRMSGYTSHELLKMNVSELEIKEPEQQFTKHMKALVLKGQDRFESKHRRKDGSVFDVEISVQYKQRDGGRYFCFLRDITLQKQLAEQLRQAQKMESIGNLAGGIAHDFNNILFPIIGMAEILKEDLPPGSSEQENADEILQAGKRASELVKQILAFSRQHEHEMLPVKVQQIIKDVLKLSRSSIPTNIEINQFLQPDCSMVLADATQLHQIGMNLVTNAYHAVQDQGGTITVEVREIEVGEKLNDLEMSPGKYATLTVSDTGIGIPEEHMDKIFEPYFTTKELGKGTGLGLSVVYGIVKEHHGEIQVTSKQGKGSSFKIYLPVIAAHTSVDVTNNTSLLPTGTEHILLVDDEPQIAKLEKQMLERLGYKVTELTSSLGVLEIFRKNPDMYDLVISDMSMPQMTGDQLARELLALRPDIPVIICTGFSERFSKEDLLKMGIKSVLMKPVVKSIIAKEVRNILDA